MRVKQLLIAGTVVPCIPMEDAFFIDREKCSRCIINDYGQEYITVWDYIKESFITLGSTVGMIVNDYDVKYRTLHKQIYVIFNVSVTVNTITTIAECFGLRGDTECIEIRDNKLTITIDVEK